MVRTFSVFVLVIAASVSPAWADPAPAETIVNTATLDGNAFAAAAGLLRVNEASGIGNRQANVATIAFGPVSDTALANSVSQQGPAHIPNLPAQNRVGVTPGAFAHASGLVQINQAAGDNDASVNTFTLQVHP